MNLKDFIKQEDESLLPKSTLNEQVEEKVEEVVVSEEKEVEKEKEKEIDIVITEEDLLGGSVEKVEKKKEVKKEAEKIEEQEEVRVSNCS